MIVARGHGTGSTKRTLGLAVDGMDEMEKGDDLDLVAVEPGVMDLVLPSCRVLWWSPRVG